MRKNQKGVHENLLRSFAAADLGVLVIILIAILVRLGWFAYTHHTEEDAFITFRYARQISAGNGFVYNTGQKRYGTTTPLLPSCLSPGSNYPKI